MRLPLTLTLTAVIALTSCGAIRESRFNPLNWFGRSQEAQVDEFGITRPVDGRELVAQVLGMVVEVRA